VTPFLPSPSTGCSGTHTLDLPARNRTSDQDVMAFANQNGAVVVTKDSDFVDSHLLLGRPAKLLLISTGNISNNELQA
jgi:predicted nuclease of predicted toxin-antitoxin system